VDATLFEECMDGRKAEGEFSLISPEDFADLRSMCDRHQLFCGANTHGGIRMSGHLFLPSAGVQKGGVLFTDENPKSHDQGQFAAAASLREHKLRRSTAQRFGRTRSLSEWGAYVRRLLQSFLRGRQKG